MNNLQEAEVTVEPIMMSTPLTVQAYGKERPRTPLVQMTRSAPSRSLPTHMRFNPGAAFGTISAVPNVRNTAKRGTRSLSPPAPLKRAFGGRRRLTARKASKHGRRRHGRRYRSRHTRR